MLVASLGKRFERYTEKFLDGFSSEIIGGVPRAFQMALCAMVSGMSGTRAKGFFVLASHIVCSERFRHDLEMPLPPQWFNVQECGSHCPSPAPLSSSLRVERASMTKGA